MRRLLLLIVLAGCDSRPYCLTCEHPLTTDDGGAPDLSHVPDLATSDGPQGPCVVSNGGVEICDGKDNDCNGLTDDVDPAKLAGDPNNCGACGIVCNFLQTHQFGACMTDSAGKPACVATGCMPGFIDIDPNQPGCEYFCTPTVPPTEVCDGNDNDCDGQVDNGLTPPTGMCSDKGVCHGVAIPTVCKGLAGWKCDYTSVPDIELDPSGNLAVIESVCNGKDGNCNGITDLDGFPTVGNGCSAGLGRCQNRGHVSCASTTTVGCDVVPSPDNAIDELCNGVDDNCDGNIDEAVPASGTMCAGGTRACLGWRDPMVAVPFGGGTVYVYRYEATRPDATATSPGGKSARACSNAGVMPWSGLTEVQADAACHAVKDSTGASMRLCTADEWRTACEGPGGPPSSGSKWSIAPTPQPSPTGVCNDNRVGAVWATGTTGPGSVAAGEQCYTDWGSNHRLYDMSGNLFEWTSTQVMAEGNTYYEARGGAYSTPADGATCENDFVIYPATFVNADVGFRCCADATP